MTLDKALPSSASYVGREPSSWSCFEDKEEQCTWRAELGAWPTVSTASTSTVTSIITAVACSPDSLGHTRVPLWPLQEKKKSGKILNCFSATLTGPPTPGRLSWLAWLQGLSPLLKDANGQRSRHHSTCGACAAGTPTHSWSCFCTGSRGGAMLPPKLSGWLPAGTTSAVTSVLSQGKFFTNSNREAFSYARLWVRCCGNTEKSIKCTFQTKDYSDMRKMSYDTMRRPNIKQNSVYLRGDSMKIKYSKGPVDIKVLKRFVSFVYKFYIWSSF